MLGLLLIAVVLPLLLGGAFLLGRYMRERRHTEGDLSPVTRQHLDLYQGGQLNEAAVEATKRRFREWLERGEVERVESSLRPGTQFVVQVRALAEIGTEDACRILERQLQRQLSDNQIEQAWYWIDLANSLRNLQREESLPLLLNCVAQADDFPLVHYFAAETVCFLGFGGYVRRWQTPSGQAALRAMHRALEGMRYGVPPHVVIEARLGEILEALWDDRPVPPRPLLVRLFAETRRFIRRAGQAEVALADEPFEQEAFRLQMARLVALDGAMEEYLQDGRQHLVRSLATTRGSARRDLLFALNDLRVDTGPALLPVLLEARNEHAELAAHVARWTCDPAVGTFLREWVGRTLSVPQRGMKRIQPWPPRRPSTPAHFPYRAILFALRGHPSRECEQFLLAAAHDWDPTFRSAAISSLGWWEPYCRAEVLVHLQDARFDPSPDVRHAGRAALARLGERQALQWFRQALNSDNRQRVVEAVQAIAVEGLTLLWPDLDHLTDGEDPELAYWAREALEQMQEDLDHRLGR
jgi:HEAT repeat protein